MTPIEGENLMSESESYFAKIREVRLQTKALDQIPLTGFAPSFSWEELSNRLSHTFGLEKCHFLPGEILWRSKEDLEQELGGQNIILNFSIPTIKGQVCFVLPKAEVELLTTLLLTKSSQPQLHIQETSLVESFYRFFVLEVLYHFNQVIEDKKISPVLTSTETIPSSDALTWTITLEVNDKKVQGQILLSPQFRESWVKYFEKNSARTQLSKKISQEVEADLHLEIGQTQLYLDEWREVKEGDFIILDSCSFDVTKCEGPLLLAVKGRPLFKGKLNKGKIKILERPLFQEVGAAMIKKKDDDEENDLTDLDFDEDDLDEEFDDFDDDEKLFEDTQGDELSEDFSSDETATNDEELELEEDEMENDEDDQLKENEEISESETSKLKKQIPEEKAKIVKNAPITVEQIPITLTIEIGRIQMSVEELLKLEPGNMLDLDCSPENGVEITVKGKVVGKGELIRIGEALGVRVIQLGKE